MPEESKSKQEAVKPAVESSESKICGIIRPISKFSHGGREYSEEFWEDIQAFLVDVIKSCGYEPQEVWRGATAETIHGEIITNLYKFKLCVCVAIGLNPNVMTELGLRLAFNKPVVVLFDDFTTLPFDIGHLKGVKFPTKNLNYTNLESCKRDLKERLNASSSNKEVKYIEHYLTKFVPAEIKAEKTIPFDEFFTEMKGTLGRIETRLSTLERNDTQNEIPVDRQFRYDNDEMIIAVKLDKYAKMLRDKSLGPDIRRRIRIDLGEISKEILNRMNNNNGTISRRRLKAMWEQSEELQAQLSL